MCAALLLLMGAFMESDVDRKKLLLPGMARLYEILVPLSYPLIRFSLGVFLIPHGYAKLFQDDAVAASRNFMNFGWSYPLAWAYFIGALEFFGGIMLAIGLLTRVVAAAFVIEMSVISFGVLWPVWSWGRRGMGYALLMGIVSLAIMVRGGGRYAVDHYIGREL
jgi:putative oxidoreductase